MKIRLYVMTIIILLVLSGCSFDPYQKPKYGEMAIDAWFSDENLGEVRKKAENIDELISKSCTFVDNKSNKYVFSCNIVYKEKGETVIPLSKNSTINVYAVFIKENGNNFNYKVYNSSSKNGVWKNDESLNY